MLQYGKNGVNFVRMLLVFGTSTTSKIQALSLRLPPVPSARPRPIPLEALPLEQRIPPACACSPCAACPFRLRESRPLLSGSATRSPQSARALRPGSESAWRRSGQGSREKCLSVTLLNGDRLLTSWRRSDPCSGVHFAKTGWLCSLIFRFFAFGLRGSEEVSHAVAFGGHTCNGRSCPAEPAPQASQLRFDRNFLKNDTTPQFYGGDVTVLCPNIDDAQGSFLLATKVSLLAGV